MGTTAEKLEKILVSKNAIKTAIQSKGQPITNTTPLNEYATHINNIKVIKEEEEVTVTPLSSTQEILPTEGKVINKVNVNAVTSEIDSSILPENIKKGVSILGVTGNCTSLKVLLNDTKSTYRLFYSYKKTSVDHLIQYNDTENVTDMFEMFSFSQNLTTIPKLNTSNVTRMRDMFYYCSSLKTIPELNTSNVTDMYEMFYNCSSLTSIPKLNTSNVTDMYEMFYGCSSLTTIPELNTNNVTDMESMFEGCSSLTSIPKLNTSNIKSMYKMFSNCAKLTTIPELNMINVSNVYQMFINCRALTNLTLLNIKRSTLQIGSGTSWGHLLTLESLINTIMELVNAGSARVLTMGTANLEKIANIYVRRTTEGDVPICLDDNSNIDLAKGPCEVCASTDERAMTITAYANLKGWTLA